VKFLELVEKRRSCRRYADKPVPRDAIERCLEAARLAPSACNSQPWRFIVVQEEPLREKLAEAAFSGLYAMNKFAKKARALVVVLREPSTYCAKLAGFFRGTQYSLIDLGIACEHFILQAAEEGLGTCWLGWFDTRGTKKALGLPKSSRVDIIISLGYPENDSMMEKPRKTINEISEVI